MNILWLLFLAGIVVITPIVVLIGFIPIIIKSYKLLRIRLKKVDQEIEEYEREKREPAPIHKKDNRPTFEEWKAAREAEQSKDQSTT